MVGVNKLTKKPSDPLTFVCLVFLDPLNKFMLLKQCEWPASTSTNGAMMYDNSVFEMIILPELEYPLVCVGVTKTFGGSGLKLELINTNSGKRAFLLIFSMT